MTRIALEIDSQEADSLASSGIGEELHRYLLKLWLPIVAYTAIELSLRGYSVAIIGNNIGGIGFGHLLSFIARTFFEAAILTQLAYLINGKQFSLEWLWSIPWERAFMLLWTRILELIAFAIPLLILNVAFHNTDFQALRAAGHSYTQLSMSIYMLVYIYALIYLLFSWWFHGYFVIYDHLGPVSSLKNSFALVKGHWWTTASSVCYALVYGATAILVLTIIFSSLLGGGAMLLGKIGLLNSPSHQALFNEWSSVGSVVFKYLITSFAFQAYVSVTLVARFLFLKTFPRLPMQESNKKVSDEDIDEDDD